MANAHIKCQLLLSLCSEVSTQTALLVVSHGLAQLLLGVHDKGALGCDGLVQRLPT